MSVKVKIKKITDDPDFIYPSYAHDGDSGMDVYSLENIWLPEGSTHLFKLGFEVEFPKGYEIQVRSKSGLALKEGLVVLNSPGTVDQSYRGCLGVILHNTRKKNESSIEEALVSTKLIKKGQKIAQIVLCPVIECEWEKVEELNETNRGEGGYGSTGV
jgi:dUTP pyrophosphatase